MPSGTRLPVPDCLSEKTFSSSDAKRFCVGLLEGDCAHPWRELLRGLSASQRLTVEGSLFLFRKCLPSQGDPAALRSSHRERLCTAPARVQLPTGYLSHCRRIANECFPQGWDNQYRDLAWGSTPSIASCLENSKSKGGARATRPDRASFLRSALEDGPELDISRDVRFMVVSEGGKDRMVTVGSREQGVLRPLHKALYNRLSKMPWLLRGEASVSKLDDFRCVEGEVFVSGDYEAATDYLPLEVAEVLLEVALRNSSWVPHRLRRAAMRALRSRIHYDDCEEPFDQAVGQLMGNLLSFPLLCLQNYAAFRWVFPESVPVKINGDDIVFRSRREDFDRWAAHVSSVGLRLSPGKTMVHSRFFSINSHFFRSHRNRRPALIPVLRAAGLSKPVESYSGLGGACARFCRGFTGSTRILVESMFLRARAKAIRFSGRSVIRDLRIRVGVESLQRSGLWRRECWYAESVPRSVDLPEDPCRLQWASVPDGWSRVPRKPPSRSGRRLERERQSAFIRELVHTAWQSDVSYGQATDCYHREVSTSGWENKYDEWRKRRQPAVLRRRLFSGWVTSRPICHGGDIVRRWVSDGPPVHFPRVGVGYGVRPRMVWVPLCASEEESVREVERVWWDQPAYQSTLLGN